MPGLPDGSKRALTASSFLVECQQCRQSFVVDVPIGFYVPSRCAPCRGGAGLVPVKPDRDEIERDKYRFRERRRAQ